MSQDGYTLVELLVVITLISVVVVVSPMSRNIYRTFETIITINNVMTDFRWARYKAIEGNREIRIRVYSDDEIYKNDKDLAKDYVIYDDLSNEIIKEGTYPKYLILHKNLNEVRITDDYYDRIKFRYDGTALHGTIGFQFGNKIYKVVVSRLGRVRLAK